MTVRSSASDVSRRLVRAIVQSDAAAARGCAADPAFDLKSFGRFLLTHQLPATVYACLAGGFAPRMFPDTFTDDLKRLYLLQWKRNERAMAEIRRLSGLARRGGVRMLFLKGPLFALRYYGDLAARETHDLDVWVPEADVAAAEGMLEGAGYRRASRLWFGRPGALRFTHHFEYLSDAAKVELHWALDRHVSYRIDSDRLWSDRHARTAGGDTYDVPSPEYELVCLILSVFKDLQLGTLALKLVVDLDRWMREASSQTDWDSFFAARRREGIETVSRAVLDWYLDEFAVRSECAGLPDYLERTRDRSARAAKVRRPDFWAASPAAWQNKLWALRHYDAPLTASLSWWIVSLPHRLAVYVKRQPAAGD